MPGRCGATYQNVLSLSALPCNSSGSRVAQARPHARIRLISTIRSAAEAQLCSRLFRLLLKLPTIELHARKTLSYRRCGLAVLIHVFIRQLCSLLL